MPKQISPGYVLAVGIVRTLDERDPKFLEALRTNLETLRAGQPKDGTTYETLSAFLAAMNDRDLFPPAPTPASPPSVLTVSRPVPKKPSDAR